MIQIFWDFGSALPAAFLILGWMVYFVACLFEPYSETVVTESVAEYENFEFEIPGNRYSDEPASTTRKVVYKNPRLDVNGNPLMKVVSKTHKGRGRIMITGEEHKQVKITIRRTPYVIDLRLIDEEKLAKQMRLRFQGQRPNPPDVSVGPFKINGLADEMQVQKAINDRLHSNKIRPLDPKQTIYYLYYLPDVKEVVTHAVEKRPIVEFKKRIDPEDFALGGAIIGSLLTIMGGVARYRGIIPESNSQNNDTKRN